MELRPLGDTGLDVSAICLGTMTFGEQNTEAEAHRQLDCAFDFGVNFIDTAEMYASPDLCAHPRDSPSNILALGWLPPASRETEVVVATKVVGAQRIHGLSAWRTAPERKTDQSSDRRQSPSPADGLH